MDIETSKNDNTLEESCKENIDESNSEIKESDEANSEIIEKKEPISENTDEYSNIIIDGEDSSECENNNEYYNEYNEDSDNRIEDYNEGFKDGYEKGARDALKAMFKLGCIPRLRSFRNRR